MHELIVTWFIFWLLIGCGHAKPKPAPSDPSANVVAEYQDAVARLVGGFLDRGWVVSRSADGIPGTPEHTGEGLIWSGMALAALPCAEGQVIEDALIDMIDRGGGSLVRYEPLGEYAGGREVTLDGALGLYRGVANRTARCPGSGDKWRAALKLERAYLGNPGARLNRAAPATLGDFDYVLDLLSDRLGLTGKPSADRKTKLEGEIAAWALAVNASHSAAYRVNLGMIALETIEDLGEAISQTGRDQFCDATRGVEIPTVDEWCGRGGLKDWISGFQYNQWEYRFQRSGSWEKPDGDGLNTPGLDLIVAMQQVYKIADKVD